MRKLLALLSLCVFILNVLPTSRSFAQATPTKTIADLIQDAANDSAKPEFTIYLAALKANDPKLLARLADNNSTSTVFAPTDAAFKRYLRIFGDRKIEDMVKYGALFNPILEHSIVPGIALTTKTLTDDDGAWVGTLLDDSFEVVAVKKGKLTYDDAPIEVMDVQATNGILHGVAGSIYANPNLDFGMLAQPPAAPTAAATLQGSQAKSLADTVASSSNFKTLASALKAADPAVLKTLSSDGPYTVLAPTDEGFTNTLKKLSVSPADFLARKDLTHVLLYHVLPGSISKRKLDVLVGMADGLTGKPLMIITLTGQVVTVKEDGDLVSFNDDPRAHSDNRVANGRLYKIDGVLVPKP